MYNSFGETLANEWTPKTVCESRADWLKFEDLSNRDQLVKDVKRFGMGLLQALREPDRFTSEHFQLIYQELSYSKRD